MTLKHFGVVSFLLGITVLGAGSIWYTAYRLRNHREFIDNNMPTAKQIERAKGETITLTETQNGNRKWVLKMKELKYAKNNNVAQMIGVQGLVYGKKQDVLFTFTAPTGTYSKDSNQVSLTNGAKMVSPSAKVLISAPQMVWSSKNDEVKASGGVHMLKDGFGESSAQKAVFSMDFSKIQFIGDATSIIGGHPNAGDSN